MLSVSCVVVKVTEIRPEDVLQVLDAWANSQLSPAEVHAWAEQRYAASRYDVADWDEQDRSRCNQVLAELDMLDMNLLTSADVAALRRFLLDSGDFDLSLETLEQELAARDLSDRMMALREDPLYAPFCG